ncbi:MAG: PEP-CTERM sorting domain-containing protein, partial [Verrucomicrobiota bacterium]
FIFSLTACVAFCTCSASAETVVFGSDNDGTGGFAHTAISGTNTFLTTEAGSVEFRNESTGTVDAAFIKQFNSIDRTPDSGLIYTVTGSFTVSDGYADDNNRLGLVLFTDPTTVLSRDNRSDNSSGQIGIIWNLDDGSDNSGPAGSNADDDLAILDGFNNVDAGVAEVDRNSTIVYAQDLLQGGTITMSATFSFTGTDLNIDASLTDAGGVTTIGTTTVTADDFQSDYFGFVSAYRARNFDGDPDPTGADRDNPLILDYESFSLTAVPEPSSLALVGLGGLCFLRRRRA